MIIKVDVSSWNHEPHIHWARLALERVFQLVENPWSAWGGLGHIRPVIKDERLPK
jgi:hypothetical protein